MKRVVSSSIVTFLVLIAAAAAFFYLRNLNREEGDPVSCIPADAVFYLESAPGKEAITSLLKPGAWSDWGSAPALSRLSKHLKQAASLVESGDQSGKFISDGKLFLSAHVTGAGTFDFLFLKGTGESREVINSMLLSLAGEKATSEEREYDGNIVSEIRLPDGKTFTWTLAKGVFAGSYTSFLVEDALRQQKVGKAAVWKRQDPSMEEGFRFYLNFAGLPSFLSQYTRTDYNGFSALKNFCNWFAADVQASKEGFVLSGNLEQLDTLRFINCFKGQSPVKSTILDGLPATTAALLWYGASDYSAYVRKLDTFIQSEGSTDQLARDSKKYGVDIRKLMTAWVGGQYALVITEPSSAQYDNSVYAVFKASDPEKARKSLQKLIEAVDSKLNERTRKEEYQGHTISYIRLQGVIQALYGNRFSRLNRMYYTISGDHVIFANQASSLRNYIDEVKDGHTFTPSIKGLIPRQGANFICLFRPEPSIPIFSAVANSQWKTGVDKYRDVLAGSGMFSFVMTAAGEQVLATARLDRQAKPGAPARLLFSIESDTSVSMTPLLVHTKAGEARIVFQDDANVLTMADDAGNVVWTTGLDSRIIGDIHPVDYFKNGKMQFLFNTSSHIHLIDSEGKPVGNYPIRLPAAATNSLTLTSADGVKDDVIYLACANNKVYAYVLSGRPLQGWNFVGTPGLVEYPILAFRSGKKRLLLICDNQGTASVVSTSGNTEVSLSQGFTPASNAFVYTDSTADSKTMIVTTDPSGNIIKVASDGSVEVFPVAAAGEGHGFIYADADGDGQRDYIFSSGREVTAYDLSMAVLYRNQLDGDLSGGITPVELPGGEPGYGISSQVLNKTWLYKMDGKIVEGFPVRGSGGFTVGSLGSDGKFNLITGGKGNSVNVYSLN